MAAFASSSLVREWAYQALSGLGDARASVFAPEWQERRTFEARPPPRFEDVPT